MRLSQEALKEFEKLYWQDHPNEKITKEELLDMATRTFRIIELIYKPIPKEKIKEFRKLNDEGS
jgi:hypothetical protein